MKQRGGPQESLDAPPHGRVRARGGRLALALAVACLLSASAILVAGEDAPDAKRVNALIQQLGAKSYKDRQAAEKELKGYSREILPLLEKHADSDDPEIQLRARRVIVFLQNDPTKIPQSCFVITPQANLSHTERRKRWKEKSEAWRKKAKIAAEHTKGAAGSGGSFAQSFTPKCKQIQAVELQTYPIGSSWGWVRLDVHADDAGRPGRYVLARCWLRMPKNCAATHSDFVVFDIPDVKVNPDAPYWLAFYEHPDADSADHGCITNFGLSTNNEYKEGKLWRLGSSRPGENEDAKFRIISECGEVPLIHKASDEEKKTLPDPKKLQSGWPARPRPEGNRARFLLR